MEALEACVDLPSDIQQINAQASLATQNYCGGGIHELAQLICDDCSNEITTCMRIWYWIISHLDPPSSTWQVCDPNILQSVQIGVCE